MLASLGCRRDDDYDYDGLDHDLHKYLAFDLLCHWFVLLSIELLCIVMFGIALHCSALLCTQLIGNALVCITLH